MTVRWKPLLILSGLFVVVALGGLMSFAWYKGSRGTADMLARARVERSAKQFDKAKTDYERALQQDGRNAAIHEEMADLYDEWASNAPSEKKAELRGLYLSSLTFAANNSGKKAGPKRRMLAEAIRQDDVIEQIRWSKSLITIDPNNLDAHYVLAADSLDGTSPNIPELRRHQKVLDTEIPRRVRSEWIAARAAALTNDKPRLDEILKKSHSMTLQSGADSTDRMAMLRLRALEVATTTDVAALSGPIEAVSQEALAASSEPEIPSTRIARISLLIEEVQKALIRRGMETPASQEKLKAFADNLDAASETIFQKSLNVKGGAELNVYLAYADHLRFRDQRSRCLTVVNQAFKSPAATKQAATETAAGLHALAVEACLANFNDAGRYEASSPHIKALLECKFSRFQALGHLFQGAIDLEKAGMVADSQAPTISRADQAKLRSSALGHLKNASTNLPNLAEAQARYGVALILNQEPAMGRQYLQLAQRLGNLEPQYQIWAAWSVVQAGYPEDAEPMVARMLEEIKAGRLPKALEGTLHLLNGEIHQARKSPADLKKAVEEYGRAFADGQDATPAVELRLAQIEVMLGRPADALKRIDWLVSKGKAGPAAENLAVLTLFELKRDEDGRKRLAESRAKYPDSSELVMLEASQLLNAKRAEDANRLLTEFLAKVPDIVPVVQMKAQILIQDLNQPSEARKLLSAVSERADNSAPLVQLALLDLAAKDYPAVSNTIAKIRARWKDVATAELLDAQLALARNDLASASGFFDAALKKDPNNKIVQFWKAQLDGRTDPEAAAKVFQSLAQGDSIKEVENGLSLATASQSALAGIAFETGNLDVAIARYREMLKDSLSPALARPIRWQIITAQAAKKEWAAAKAEINLLLNDPASPPTPEELVRAATFFRLNKEDATALSLSEQVLKKDPGYPGAVVTKAEILARTNKHAEALATIQQAIEVSTKVNKKAPPVLYLMMAAVESTTPPTADGFKRAMVVLDRGLAETPDSTELVQAKCRVLITITQDPKAGASYLEDRAKANPKGPYRGMLLNLLAESSEYAAAERVASEMVKEDPNNSGAAAAQVRMIAAQSFEANNKGNRAETKRLDEKASALLYEFRGRFKTDWTFVQLDSELELRRGDTTRALTLSQEVDTMAKGSAVGPLLRAQIFAKKGQPREAADAYTEALKRNPRLAEARLQLARLRLRTGENDEALRQAKFLLDADPDKPTALAALLVEARATASQTGTPAQVQANRTKALTKLAELIKNRPDFADAYYLMADIHMLNQDRVAAVGILKDALKIRPDDAPALTMAIQILSEPRSKGQAAPKSDLDQAIALAKSSTETDTKGNRMLSVSNGFSRAGQIDLALPYSQKAVDKLGSIPARVNLGDLLLTQSEAVGDATQARELQDRALAEYDKILDAQPNLIEAVNNKAWILHTYKNDSKKALELAQGLIQRVDPSSLPGEFYDTLGSIQEAMNRPKEAEESYKKGLGKSPEHPVLNLHMGSLMLTGNDKTRNRKAADYLKVAQASSEKLPAAMAVKLASLLKQVGQ